MKRFFQTGAALVAIAVLLVIFVPMGVGLLFVHDYYPRLIREIAKQDHLDLKLVKSHWGWFSSHATLSLQMEGFDKPFLIHQTIRPGPIVFVPNHGPKLTFAWIGTTHQGKKLPFFGDTFVTPSLRTHLQSPGVHLTFNNQIIQASKIRYHRIDGHNSHEQTLAAGMVVIHSKPTAAHPISVQASGVSYLTKKSLKNKNEESLSRIHAKHLYLTIPRLGVWEANNITGIVTEKNHDDRVSFAYHLDADKLLSPMIAPRRGSLTLSINDLNKHALADLLKKLPTLSSHGAAEQFLTLYLMMGDLLSHGAQIHLKQFVLSSPQGLIQVTGSLMLSPVTKKTNNPAAESLKHAKMIVQATLPRAVFIDLLTQHASFDAMRHMNQQKPISHKAIQTAAKKVAFAQTIQWAAQRNIAVNNKQVSFTLILENEHLYFIGVDQQRRPLVWMVSTKPHTPSKPSQKKHVVNKVKAKS